MATADADSAVAQFLGLMDRVQAMIFARRNPIEVIPLLRDARALLERAEAAVRDPTDHERHRLLTALPHLHWKLVQLEQVAKLVR